MTTRGQVKKSGNGHDVPITFGKINTSSVESAGISLDPRTLVLFFNFFEIESYMIEYIK